MLEQYRLKEVTADWKSFGMQLGIPYMELNAFDQGRNTPRRCMEELLIVWIQCRGKNANMSAIIKACEGVGDYALADRLKENNDIKRIMRRSELMNVLKRLVFIIILHNYSYKHLS